MGSSSLASMCKETMLGGSFLNSMLGGHKSFAVVLGGTGKPTRMARKGNRRVLFKGLRTCLVTVLTLTTDAQSSNTAHPSFP